MHTTGKLFIGGVGLATGYWHDPAQTAARFVHHPHTGERLYDTGDLGRYRPDGTIEFLGREDHQVKLRGFRIELGEIEAALTQHPRVHHAIALLHRHGDTQRLVAYVVPTESLQETSSHTSDEDRILSDPLARMAFTLEQHGRPPTARILQPLRFPVEPSTRRASTRFWRVRATAAFMPRGDDDGEIGGWLGASRRCGSTTLRSPSASTRRPAVSIRFGLFLVVKPGAVEGARGRAYVYDPLRIDSPGSATRSWTPDDVATFNSPDRRAAPRLAVFLVGHLPAIRPLYGEWARDACLLEAGYVGQTLTPGRPRSEHRHVCASAAWTKPGFGRARAWRRA